MKWQNSGRGLVAPEHDRLRLLECSEVAPDLVAHRRDVPCKDNVEEDDGQNMEERRKKEMTRKTGGTSPAAALAS